MQQECLSQRAKGRAWGRLPVGRADRKEDVIKGKRRMPTPAGDSGTAWEWRARMEPAFCASHQQDRAYQ
jgi:hypothetical protein